MALQTPSKNTSGVVNWPWQAAQLGQYIVTYFFEFIYVANLEFIKRE